MTAAEIAAATDDALRAERQRLRRTVGVPSASDALRLQAVTDELNARTRERSHR